MNAAAATESGTHTILIVDDDRSNGESLERIFQREGFQTVLAAGGREALDRLRQRPVDVVLTDLMMPDVNGLDLLKTVRDLTPTTEVVLMTAYGSVEKAVEAMKEGAYDFVAKPFKRIQIVKAVRKAAEKRALTLENIDLRKKLAGLRGDERRIVGQSEALRRTLEIVRQAAPSSATVLIEAETGTGKELVARALHEHSRRAAGPFVAVNCSAIPESIIEAELFGYERGSFTGATEAREGRFKSADKGTLFLDEIGELSAHVQVKLLRALQDGEIERIGGGTLRVDVRLVAATNRSLDAEVKAGRFREDLFYRLNVITIGIPPLRDRREDIPLLADFFLRKYSDKNGRQMSGFSAEALETLAGHAWPGNVRELENAVERAVVLCRADTIGVEDLPEPVRRGERAQGAVTFAVGTPLEEVERRLIQETLRHTRGDKRRAAQLLGIATRTIYRKLAADRGELGAGEDDWPGDELGEGGGAAGEGDGAAASAPAGGEGEQTAAAAATGAAVVAPAAPAASSGGAAGGPSRAGGPAATPR
jgi:DNA-binding NtrC family response regulator